MSYEEFINNILKTRGRFNVPENEYKERHHILPKCLGGSDNEDNLIDLYAKEHFIAHKLLMLENPGNYKLATAFSNMAFKASSNTKRMLTPDEYEEARVLYSSAIKGIPRPEILKIKLHENALINDNYGMKNKKQSESTKAKISKQNSGMNNPSKLLGSRIRISESAKSAKKIIINRNFSEETKISTSQLDEYLKNGWSLGFSEKHKSNLKKTKSDGRKTRNTKVVIDYDTLFKKYVIEQKTIPDIAKEYNCSPVVIRKYLKMFNLSIDTLKEYYNFHDK